MSPWEIVDALVDEAREQTPVVVLDFHAEATSEKVAMARWLDGRVTAVIGTHTHVQTNDARVLPGGTAAITDAGMTGPHDSVIGVKAELAIRRMRTRLPVRFEPAEGGVRIEGVVVDCSDDGRASGIELLRLDALALLSRRGRACEHGGGREHRDRGEAEEPRDVRVEPVRQAELEAGEERGRERGELERRLVARHERDDESARDEQALQHVLDDAAGSGRPRA